MKMNNQMMELTPAAFPATSFENDYVADLTKPSIAFSSMAANTAEEKKLLFNAMNSPDYRIKDCVNKRIIVRDVYCEIVNTISENGLTSSVPRTVLIDIDGKSYQAVSMGIYNALRKLIQVFGTPTWENGLEVEVKLVSKGNNSILTLNIV